MTSKWRTARFALAAMVVVCLSVASLASAQSGLGGLRGAVTDQQGAGLPGVTVTATSPDGVAEAMERAGSQFCVAVQWHPENFWRTGEFRELFQGLIQAANQRKK